MNFFLLNPILSQQICFLVDFVNASVCRTYEDSNVKFSFNVTKLLS
jgi:hypothetical protein